MLAARRSCNINESGQREPLHVLSVYLASKPDVHNDGGELAVEFRLAPVAIYSLSEVEQESCLPYPSAALAVSLGLQICEPHTIGKIVWTYQ